MNDVPTIEVVYHLYKMLGYNLIAEALKKDKINIDHYINLLKLRSKKYPHLTDFIEYFL